MGFKGGAGALDQVCTFEVKTDTVTSRGGASESWVPAFTTRCAVKYMTGQEYPKLGARDIIAEKRQGETKALFRIRYRAGITKSTHRILYDSKIWNITDVRDRPPGRKIELELDTTFIQ